MLQRQSTGELLRAITLLRLCRYNAIVDRSEQLMDGTRRTVGKAAFEATMRHTVYGHFVAGEDLASIQRVAARLAKDNVDCMFYVHVESDEGEAYSDAQSLATLHEQNKDLMLEATDSAPANSNIQVKMTGIASVPLLVDLTNAMRESSLLPTSDRASLAEVARNPDSLSSIPRDVAEKHSGAIRGIQRRLHQLAEHAAARNAFVVIDAEQTYFQPAIQRLVLPVMLRWNAKSRPLVYTTVQGYLKESEARIQECLDLFEQENSRFALKLVRGAYMKQERSRAEAMGYESPICESAEHTSRVYNGIARTMIERASQDAATLMLATHNLESVQLAMAQMEARNITNDDRTKVSFAQIYGLADYLTSDLASNGYVTCKSTPSGPIDGVLGYLARRAQENNSVFARNHTESKHLWKEIIRRFSARSKKPATPAV